MNYSNESSQAELVIPESNLLKSYSDKSESIESFNIISNMKDLINQTIQIVKKESPALYWIVVAHFVFALICIPGLLFDERLLMGINVWVKPLKFLISSGIYIFTFGYFTSLYPFSKRKKSILNNFVAWTLLVETAIIVGQGIRGVQSHYNIHSLVDGLLFAAMGILIAVNVLVMVYYVIETIRLKMNTSKSIQWSILLGWVVLIIGSLVGGQMISQMSHNVGVADGESGLPLVNWSTIAGDLRIAHFFGIHGMQIIPLFAFGISKEWKTTNRNQIIAVTIFGLSYALWLGYTFYQAKQGMALINL
tara:strand:- start:667 stop:1584 length:918 start_codon:yes stop_codon:yes gene_type:complete